MAYIVPDELLRAREAAIEEARTFEALQEITAGRRACGAVHGSGVQTSREASPVEVAAERQEKAAAEWSAACSASIAAARVARDLIEPLPASEWAVLYYRYIMGRMWQDVAAAMGCSRSNVMQHHRKALERLAGWGG